MKRLLIIIIPVLGVAGALLIAAIRKTDSAASTAEESALRLQTDALNSHAADSAVSMLRSGDLVLRLGQGADSYILSQMNLRNKNYSHCGIVMLEHGYPFVYHAIGGELNPDARMRRDSARFFFSTINNLAIAIVRYDFGVEKVCELRDTVLSYYRRRPRFDMKFDLATDDKIYCAELVYKSVNSVMRDTGYIRPSHAFGYTFAALDDLFLSPHATFVWQTKYK